MLITNNKSFLIEEFWELDLIKYNPELRLEISRIISLEFPCFVKLIFQLYHK